MSLYSENFIRDNIVAPILLLSVVIVPHPHSTWPALELFTELILYARDDGRHSVRRNVGGILS